MSEKEIVVLIVVDPLVELIIWYFGIISISQTCAHETDGKKERLQIRLQAASSVSPHTSFTNVPMLDVTLPKRQCIHHVYCL